MNEKTTYTLTLSPTYVLNWGFWEAVRELLQNAIDQQATGTASEMSLDYTNKTLRIGNQNCKLEVKSLLLGASNKRGMTKTIGQFGEGYKLALLVLSRMMHPVRILNNDMIWTPRLVWHDTFQSHLLEIEITESPEVVDGVYFEIGDVEEPHYATLTEKFLGNLPDNCILDEEHLLRKVFVGGLYVCTVQALHYGYNFAPGRITLDRDRGLASTFDVTYQASQLWERIGDKDRLYKAMEEDAPDVQYVERPAPETTNHLVQRFLAEHPETVPIATQAEANQHEKTHIVPRALRNLLHRMHKFSTFEPEDPPAKQLETFEHEHGGAWGDDTQAAWKVLLEKAREW